MSFKYNECDVFYDRMSRLEMILNESEEERVDLEEKFSMLLHTSKSKQTLQLHQLRKSYRKLLEHDRIRCERNDTIMRTLHRVEDRASAITAKTARLRLLKQHFEKIMGCNYQEGDKSIDVKISHPGETVRQIHFDASILQPASPAPQSLRQSLRSPIISRRSSLIVPDYEILELSKYKFSDESGRQQLFDDSITPKPLSYSGTLSLKGDKTDIKSEYVPSTVEMSYGTTPLLKQGEGKSSKHTVLSNVNNNGLQRSEENFVQNNSNNVIKCLFEHSVQSTHQPFKDISAKSVIKSSSFSTKQKPVTFCTPVRSVFRRPSFVSTSISSRPSNKYHSSLTSIDSHASNCIESPLNVVDDIFKKYLINYDKRYLSDTISESKYGKYLYPSKSDKKVSERYPPDVNKINLSFDTNNKYGYSQIYSNKLAVQYSYNKSNESCSATNTYQSSDFKNCTPQYSPLRSSWKEWDHFHDRYKYMQNIGASSEQHNTSYVDSMIYSETRKNGLFELLHYGDDDGSMITDTSITREHKSPRILNKKNEEIAFVLKTPLKTEHHDSDIDQTVKFKVNENDLKTPQIPKRVSFSKKYLYDEKSDTEVCLSPEEGTDEYHIFQCKQHFENKFSKSDQIDEAPRQCNNIYNDKNNKDIIDNKIIVTENTISDNKSIDTFNNILNTDIGENDLFSNDFKNKMIESPEHVANNGKENRLISEEFKDLTKATNLLISNGELTDSFDDSKTKLNNKEHLVLQSPEERERIQPNSSDESENKLLRSDSQDENADEEYFCKEPLISDSKGNFQENLIEQGQTMFEEPTLTTSLRNQDMFDINNDFGQSENVLGENIKLVDNTKRPLKERKSIYGQKNNEDFRKSEHYDLTEIMEELDINQCDELMEENIKKELGNLEETQDSKYSLINQSDIHINAENSEDYQTLSETSKYPSYSSRTLSKDNPLPVVGDGYNILNNSQQQYGLAHAQQEEKYVTRDGKIQPDITEYPVKTQNTCPQEDHKQPDILKDGCSQEPVSYNVNRDSQVAIKGYQQPLPENEVNEYIQQDTHKQDYTEKGQGQYYHSNYQRDPRVKHSLLTQYPQEYSQQPVQFEDNYQDKNLAHRQYKGGYESSYITDTHYQYGQEEANIPEATEQYNPQYQEQPNNYDIQMPNQYVQEYEKQETHYQNDQEQANISELNEDHYQIQHDLETTEQYKQYQSQPIRYGIEMPDQNDQQYENQDTQYQYSQDEANITEPNEDQCQIQHDQYQSQPIHYDIEIPDQNEQQHENQDTQYQYSRNEANIPVPNEDQYQIQHDLGTTEQYKQYQSQPIHYDNEMPQQNDQQYENQDIQYQYDQEESNIPKPNEDQFQIQHDIETTKQYKPQYQGQPNNYDITMPNQYVQQYENQDTHYQYDQEQAKMSELNKDQYQIQHDLETTEQYKQYQSHPIRYNNQMPAQNDQQYEKQGYKQITEQYQGEEMNYDNVPDQHDKKNQNYQYGQQYQSDKIHIQQITEEYDEQYKGRPNQYNFQRPYQYDQHFSEHNEQQPPDQYDPQYQGGQDRDNYIIDYEMQPDQYDPQRPDQYKQQYSDQISEQYEQHYQGGPDHCKQQYSSYERQTQDQYSEKQLPQLDQNEYEQQYSEQYDDLHAPAQYNKLYEGKSIQYGYGEEVNQQQQFAEQESYDTQYQAKLEQPSQKALPQDEKQSYNTDYIKQDTHRYIPENITLQDSEQLNTNQGAAFQNVEDQHKSPVLKHITSNAVSTKELPDLNRVLESDSESLHAHGPVAEDNSSEFDFSLGKK